MVERVQWGGGDYSANERHLEGSYLVQWKPHSQLDGKNGEFRWPGVIMAA